MQKLLKNFLLFIGKDELARCGPGALISRTIIFTSISLAFRIPIIFFTFVLRILDIYTDVNL